MPKPKDFSYSVNSLRVANTVKRVVETFLEAECTPRVWLDPKRAKRLQKMILWDVGCCAEIAIEHGPPQREKAATRALASRLQDCAAVHLARGRRDVSARLEILAEMVVAVAKSRK